MLVASESIHARGGSQLRADGNTGAAPADRILLDGDGAFLRVSSGQHVDIERGNSSGGAASLLLDAGSLLSAPGGTVALKSAGTVLFDAALDLSGGTLALIGDRISLGDTSGITEGLALSNAQLATLALDSLVLSSRNTIDLYGTIDFRAGEMSVARARAARFRRRTSATLCGFDPSVRGVDGERLVYDAGTGTGSLSLSAKGRRSREGGYAAFTGFNRVVVTAQNDIALRGRGQIDASADLSFNAQRLTAESGATRGVIVQGAFEYLPQSAGPAIPDSRELGARVQIDASSILLGARADLHSGVLDLIARSGDLTLTDTADLRLNGLVTTFDSVPVGSRGGTVLLDSREGNVSMASGARIDVGSASAATVDRGAVSIRAERGIADVQGTLVGNEAAFSLDAGQIIDFARLSRQLTAGEFTGARSIRLRGPGDLVVGTGAGEGIQARSVDLTADQGRVVVEGSVRSSAPGGGRIVLSARDGLQINGALDASAADSTQRNGHIELRSDAGPIHIAANAQVAAASTSGINRSLADGTLHIHAPRAQLDFAD